MRKILIGLIASIAISTSALAQSVFDARVGVSLGPLEAVTPVRGGGNHYSFQSPLLSGAFLSRLHSSGVQIARLPINPLPLIDPRDRADAVAGIVRYADMVQRAGIAAVVDIHFWAPDPNGGLHQALSSPNGVEQFTDAVTTLSQSLSRLPSGRVAIELLNEPPCHGPNAIAWPAMQKSLYHAVRSVAPKLPVVVTGCDGILGQLTSLDIDAYKADPNVIYTFHFYDPIIFTHQAAAYGMKSAPLRYPPETNSPDPDNSIQDTVQHASVLKAAHDYKRSNVPGLIARELHSVSTWQQQNGIAPGHVFIGEYGAMIGVTQTDPATRASEIAWLSDVTSAADAGDFSHAYWAYPTRPTSYDANPANGLLRDDVAAAVDLGPQ